MVGAPLCVSPWTSGTYGTLWYRPSSVTDGIYAALALHMLMEEAEKSGHCSCVPLSGCQRGDAVREPDDVSMTAQGQVFSRMHHCATRATACALRLKRLLSPWTGRAGCPPPWSMPRSAAVSRWTSLPLGSCSEAVLFSSETVLPPSEFTVTDVLEQAAGGTFQMPPHSVLFLRFPSID